MQGYYQKPTIHGDQVLFVCEDDLWLVGAEGGVAHRLTASPGRCSDPFFSPDGTRVAYTGRDEGHNEVHLLDLEGGLPQRLTYLGGDTRVCNFQLDDEVDFTTNAWQPFSRNYVLGSVRASGGPAHLRPWGAASAISRSPDGKGLVLGRHTWDPARWKRYRGGTAGRIWVDPQGTGDFQRLNLAGNLTRPHWIGERIFFGSDHEGWCNLYSCLPDGQDLRRHTSHNRFFLRHPNSDGKRIVYQCGADLYLFDPAENRTRKLDVRLRGAVGERLRKFPTSAHYLEGYDLHPKGHSLAVTVRGKPMTFAHWERSVQQWGARDGVRYRLLSWLHDGERLICTSDEGGEESLHLFPANERFHPEFDLGRVLMLLPSPKENKVALTNHRYQLLLADLDANTLEVLDESAYSRIGGLDWSADGSWLAYSLAVSHQTSEIRLWNLAERTRHSVTSGQFSDVAPTFDPQGRYLYFISGRTFDPIWDQQFFELSFPKGSKIYMALLREDVPNPFQPEPRAPGEDPGADKSSKKKKDEDEKDKEKDKDKEEKPEPLQIDVEGLGERILELPLAEGRYWQLEGLKDQLLFSTYPVEGTLRQDHAHAPSATGTIAAFEFKTLERKELITKVTSFRVSADRKTLVYRSGYRLRVVQAGKKPESSEESAGRKSGYVNLARLRASVTPQAEWRQMARESWRLMRDHFWTTDMSGIDWGEVWERYSSLLDRIGCRSEFSDWLWEFQGELGTSHAYESGGDYPSEPFFSMGKLAANLVWDEAAHGYRIDHMVRGDTWDPDADSPLRRPGTNLKLGDVVTHINGEALSFERPPEEKLVHMSGQEIELTVRRGDEEPRRVWVRALRFEVWARYREWVESNRRRVHELSGGRLGYVHIPNMGPEGFSEFHRGFQGEISKDGLVIDVRFNGGGNVSALLLEKLARRPLGWDVPRWGSPSPYPNDAPMGPLVALTNEMAGSDGDIFSHNFKLMKLGPLVGTRTWGGVIGIWPRHRLVDGTQTTQPEFSSWFEDVGWRLENYGTEPDVEVDIRPQDWAAGLDPQLDKAVALALERLASWPRRPDFSERPRLAPPPLSEL